MKEIEKARIVIDSAARINIPLIDEARRWDGAWHIRPLLTIDECIELAKESPYSLAEVKAAFLDAEGSLSSALVRLGRAGRDFEKALSDGIANDVSMVRRFIRRITTWFRN